jgi:4a-hydroxytetrahydrobiopterin dehydratase
VLLLLLLLLVQGWNNVTIELWTHERDGLSENDFIVAAKIDEVLAKPDVAALLSKKQPAL